jgi:ubiquinone/menaquinone biosynthesis C-methylase UbiE
MEGQLLEIDKQLKKLNLGCGKDIKEGWINLDCINLPGVNVVHDVNNLPLPFEDEYFNVILCKDVLEHIDLINVLRDIHRILKKGGKLIIQVPHFTSKDAFGDPTHRNSFAVHTFRYFTANHFRERLAYSYNYLLELLVNLNIRTQNFYEGTPLRIFPATNLVIHLIK